MLVSLSVNVKLKAFEQGRISERNTESLFKETTIKNGTFYLINCKYTNTSYRLPPKILKNFRQLKPAFSVPKQDKAI